MLSTSQNLEPTSTSTLELALRRLSHVRMPAFILSIVLAILITLGAGIISWRLSRTFYETALYHYDSAAYRVNAVRTYEAYQAQGRWITLMQTLRQKDALDINLRVLFMPSTLLHQYGHLVVLLPMMSLFFTLLLYYVHHNTRSWMLALACATFLFTFSFVYDVYWGIADYWKDNLATWLLGAAIIAWLFSKKLTLWRWSLLSSTLLGLLVVQRSVAAVYAALLFSPLFIWALAYHIKHYPIKITLAHAAAFVAPAFVCGIGLVVLQWQSLYGYYFVGGYGYANPTEIGRYLGRGIILGSGRPDLPFGTTPYGTGAGPFVLLPVIVICALAVTTWKQQRGDIIASVWIVCGLPLLVMATRAYYHGFFVIWMTLLLVLLATLLPRNMSPSNARTLALTFMLIATITSGLQYFRSATQSRDLAAESAPYRTTMNSIAQIITSDPSAHTYAMFFDEADAPFLNTVFFNLHTTVGPPAVFITFHDNYYKNSFPGQTPDQIVANSMHPLEQIPGALAVGHCNLADLYQPPGDPIAAAAILGLNRYLLESPFWRVTDRLNSPFGCLYTYRFSAQPLTNVEKWRDMSFYGVQGTSQSIHEIPLTLGMTEQVRIYGYSGRYAPELINGVYYQWLPSGAPGLSLTVFSDQERIVTFQAQAEPGPSRTDPKRTLVVSDFAGSQKVQIKGEEALHVTIRLQPGLNLIDMHVTEPVNAQRADDPDKRELMLLLVSPQLTEEPR